jgi:beta-glucosidase
MRTLFVVLLASFLAAAQSPEKRAADLVSKMTLEEKVLQMQNNAPAIPRLGIPAYEWWNEALHGVARAGQATVFPQAIGIAATFDTDLMHRIGDTISTEARAKYNEAIRNNDHSRYHGLTFWSPNINIFRDPRWGRGQETFGEDPFLTGRLAVAFIRGMQGDDPNYFKVIATAKHYAVHSGPEPARHQFDVVPSERDLRDTYLPAFRAAIVEGKADSLMCAYNRVDGVPACASTDLLQKRLRGEWGFQGFVVSDCGAISDIFRGHKYKPDAASASAVAVKAGTDLTCGTEYRFLVDAVKAGQITEAEINVSLERLFTARFKLGMFDPPEKVPFSKIPFSENDSEEHRKVALEAARKSIVLLKNENQTLPLPNTIRRIAVIGPSADDPISMLGNYNGFSAKSVTPREGIQHQFASAEIVYALGSTYTAQTPSLISADAFAPGLAAEYFDNPDFQGQPKISKVEPRPYMQAANFLDRNYNVRWTGTLHAPVTGDYTIFPRNAGRPAVRVFLDDKELIDEAAAAAEKAADTAEIAAPAGNPGGGRPRIIEWKVRLEAGRSYKLRIEYRPQTPGPAGSVQIMWTPPAAPLLDQAVAAMKSADVVLAFVGLSPSLEGEEMPVKVPGFLGGDRTDLNLPESQQRLLEAAVAGGKPVIVILTSGSAVAMTYASEHAAAMLEAWYGGEETGTAIAETLAGVNNPAGRLPVTFYRNAGQLPPFEDYAMKGRTYRYFTGDPLYGFGFGLSYSRFAYSRLKVKGDGGAAQVSVRVTNTSARDGDEVVQLYLSGVPEEAVRSLRGFQRVHLRAGESRDVTFALDDRPKRRTKISVGGGQPVGQIPHVGGVF